MLGVIDGKAPRCETASYKLVQNLRIEFEMILYSIAYGFGSLNLDFLKKLADFNKRFDALFLFVGLIFVKFLPSMET